MFFCFKIIASYFLWTLCFLSITQAQLRLFQNHEAGSNLNNLTLEDDTASSNHSNLCEAQMIKASKKYKIPVSILYAVGLTETGQKNSLQPYALNIGGRTVFAKNLSQALEIYRRAKEKKIRLIDVGCMQINVFYHGKEFSSIESMFDPEDNVDYAARFLKKLYKREKNWTMAVARYHAGPNNNPAQKRYICQVVRNLIAVGFGNWTNASKEFCFQKE